MQQGNARLSGCGLSIIVILAALAIQYVGAIVGLGLMAFAFYRQRQGEWQTKSAKFERNVLLGVGAALIVAQAAMWQDWEGDSEEAAATQTTTGPIPKQFWGTWASDLPSCRDYYSRMNIDSDRVKLPSGALFADKVSMPDSNTLIIFGSAAGSGGGDVALQKETQRLQLSTDGSRLTMGEYTNVRCPTATSTGE